MLSTRFSQTIRALSRARRPVTGAMQRLVGFFARAAPETTGRGILLRVLDELLPPFLRIILSIGPSCASVSLALAMYLSVYLSNHRSIYIYLSLSLSLSLCLCLSVTLSLAVSVLRHRLACNEGSIIKYILDTCMHHALRADVDMNSFFLESQGLGTVALERHGSPILGALRRSPGFFSHEFQGSHHIVPNTLRVWRI